MRRLPSLNAVRAFEAAARHLSFTKAAEELFVTHAAISRQVRELETGLGLKLFRRLSRGVVLTPAGQRYAARLTRLLDQLAAATAELSQESEGGVVVASIEPNFAERWLSLRLADFRSAHPAIDLQIIPTPNLVDFRRDEVDLAIRHGGGAWPQVRTLLLAPLQVFPVASPRVAERLKAPADLARATLLHEETRRWWADWLVAAGQPQIDAEKGPMMGDPSLTLNAALAGQGVALADQVIAGDELAAGRLVRPFSLQIEAGGYWLVLPPEGPDRPAVKAFADWLFAATAPHRSPAPAIIQTNRR
jgi:LysR family glycine cleavage system transcriptional activator